MVYSEYLIKRYENKAATTIQAYWRRYWQSTNYSILYCEIIKIQAVVRGHQERSWQTFQKECATIIQASSRRFLVRKECHNECMVSILIAAAANSLRVRNAAKRLQIWWVGELWRRKEKVAALKIERFFIYVKKEVEKEVKALKKKKKERRRRRKMKQSDDYILERAWLGVADDAGPAAMPAPAPPRTVVPRQPHSNNNGSVTRAYNKPDRFATRSRGVIQSVEEDTQSVVSGLTELDFGYRNRPSAKQFNDDASLEAAFRESEVQTSKKTVDHGSSGKNPRNLSRRMRHASPAARASSKTRRQGYPLRRYD